MATETGDSGADADSTPETDDAVTTAESTVSSDEEPDTDDKAGGYEQFERSLIVTTGSTLMGIAAGVTAGIYVNSPGDRLSLIILLGAIVVQFPVYSLLGMETEEFGAKGNLYIAFMTFVMWFISWTLVMTTGAL